jgi:glycosyltransferase involved in cell wall biosynthesis
MHHNKGKILFIAHNLTASGGIESVSRMIVEDRSLFGIAKVIDLNRKVNSGFHRYFSRLQIFPKVIQIFFLIVFGGYSRILVSHVAVAHRLLLMTRRIRILILCHGGEVWQNTKLRKLASEDRISWVAVSEFTKKQMENFVSHETCFANDIGNLHLTSPLFSKYKSEPLNKIPLTFMCVSRLDRTSRYKGVDTAIRIFSQIVSEYPNARLAIVGTGNDQQYYSQLINDLGIAEKVKLKGYLTLPRLLDEYLQSQFFLLPGRPTITPQRSEGEGFGIVFIEASFFGAIPIGGLGDGADR